MRKPIHLPLGKGLHCLLGLALSIYCSNIIAQQCPVIVNCAQTPSIFCDETSNEISLWNFPPFTYSPTIQNADLHESPFDLNIKVKGCNGGGLTSISFLLLLDLDNDGLQETVLKSSNLPPAGRVMANNSFNPGYSGGDTLWFDQRALPDSLLYRFTLETVYSGDTTIGRVRFCTDENPFDYLPVVLPEGRHRIEWKATQDGMDRYCDRNFTVKDCKKPTVTCKSTMGVYLDVTQAVSLNLSQVLETVSDNITLDTQLVVGMRRAGTGQGFPRDAMGNPQDTVMFSCQDEEFQDVEVWAEDRAGNLEVCSTSILVYDTAGFCPFIHYPSICARKYWNEDIIKGVRFRKSWTVPNQPPGIEFIDQDFSGCGQLSSLPPSQFTLSAAKDTFPLNGVTTYDLVLISKHILALQPLDEGWKLAAADVNQSNSITSFDIVELRKLILGLSNKLPNNTPSWKFFVDTCMAWGHPFYGACPTAYSLPLQPIGSYPPDLSFKGVKMGDVNGSAASVDSLLENSGSRGTDKALELPEVEFQAGQILEIPLRCMEGGAWEGYQFSLKFDPTALEILEVLPGDGPALAEENRAIGQDGLLRLSWSDAVPQTILPGDALFRLKLRARSNARLPEVVELQQRASLWPEIYDASGTAHTLRLAFSDKALKTEAARAQIFAPMPNPTAGGGQIPLRLISSTGVSLEVCDLSGKILWNTSTSLEAGAHYLDIPETAMPQSGVFVWRVCAGSETRSGRLVRL